MRVLRHDVPVEATSHEITCGPIVHVDCRRADTVTFWALDTNATLRHFRVFGTGDEVDPTRGWRYRGTGLSPGSPTSSHAPYGVLVWHLFEKEGTSDG
jgi:hypothetical protein